MQLLLKVAAVATSCLTLLGCDLTNAVPLIQRRGAMEVPHAPASHLAVETINGRIDVTQRAGETVQIQFTLRCETQERADASEVVAERDADGTLRVEIDWADGQALPREGCELLISMPDTRGVRAETGNGAVRVAGLSGPLEIVTSNGAIDVVHHDGPIQARTSNGAIDVVDGTGEIEADTSNGAVEVTLVDANEGPIDLTTSNGAVRLEVGPAFQGSLTAQTSHGDIRLGPFGEGIQARITSTTEESAEVVFGGSKEQESTIRTSNGDVDVTSR